jgi:hypothetical protein
VAPSFGADTTATQDTTTGPGAGPGIEETVVGVFGQGVAMVDVSVQGGGTMSGVSQFTRNLLPKAAALIENPVTPSPGDSGS